MVHAVEEADEVIVDGAQDNVVWDLAEVLMERVPNWCGEFGQGAVVVTDDGAGLLPFFGFAGVLICVDAPRVFVVLIELVWGIWELLESAHV